MNRLVECLQMLEATDLPETSETVLDSVDHDLIDEVKHAATQSMITSKGEPHFDNIDELWRTHGYFIFPGERDRFGWLTACIQTKKGIIVFG